MRRTVNVALGDFGMGSLCGAFKRNQASLARSLIRAIGYYLADQESGHAGWAYPGFWHDERAYPPVKVPIEIDDMIWQALATEAERQEVSTCQLLQHAVLYFVADRDSGRLAQRLAKSLWKGR